MTISRGYQSFPAGTAGLWHGLGAVKEGGGALHKISEGDSVFCDQTKSIAYSQRPLDQVMGIEFKIDIETGVIHIKGLGILTPKESKANDEAIMSHPDYRPNLDGLGDFRKARLIKTGRDAEFLGDLMKTMRPFKRYALVVAPERFGHARMLQGWTGDDVNYRVFTDMASAREWLDLPPEG